MTDDQIRRILESNARQTDELAKFRKEQQEFNEKQLQLNQDTADIYGRHALFVKEQFIETNKKLGDLSEEVQPIIELTQSVRLIDKLGIQVLKILFGIAALFTALGTIGLGIKWIILHLIIPKE